MSLRYLNLSQQFSWSINTFWSKNICVKHFLVQNIIENFFDKKIHEKIFDQKFFHDDKPWVDYKIQKTHKVNITYASLHTTILLYAC